MLLIVNPDIHIAMMNYITPQFPPIDGKITSVKMLKQNRVLRLTLTPASAKGVTRSKTYISI